MKRYLISLSILLLAMISDLQAADLSLPSGGHGDDLKVKSGEFQRDLKLPVLPDMTCSDFVSLMNRDFENNVEGPYAQEHLKQFRHLLEEHFPQTVTNFVVTPFTQEVVGFCAQNGEKTLGESIHAAVGSINYALTQISTRSLMRLEQRGAPPIGGHVLPIDGDTIPSNAPVSPSQEAQPPSKRSYDKNMYHTYSAPSPSSESNEPTLPKENEGATIQMDGEL